MPTAIADGPLGLEAVHELNRTHDASTFALNDWTGGLPYVQLTRITGLLGRAEADDNRQPRTARIGEQVLPSLARGKNPTYEGLLGAMTRQDALALRSSMMYAFSETSVEDTIRIVPDAAYGSLVWTYNARATQLDIDDNVAPAGAWPPYQLPFTLGLRMSDPRFYVEDEIVKGPFASASSHTCDNTGTAPTDPVIAGAKPDATTTITLENTDYLTGGAISHATLVFAGVPSAAGDVSIDFAARSASYDDGTGAVTLLPYLDTFGSNWWDGRRDGLLALNANTVKITGLDDWTATYREASW